MSGHTPWSELRRKGDSAELNALRDEFDRLGLTYGKAGARDYIACHNQGEGQVWLRGTPLTGLAWQGPYAEALDLARRLPDDAGPDLFWRELRG